VHDCQKVGAYIWYLWLLLDVSHDISGIDEIHILIERRYYSSNSSNIIALRAVAVSPGDSLEFPAKRHGAGSRCQLREAEEEREEVV
jgi:hypothetical protein